MAIHDSPSVPSIDAGPYRTPEPHPPTELEIKQAANIRVLKRDLRSAYTALAGVCILLGLTSFLSGIKLATEFDTSPVQIGGMFLGFLLALECFLLSRVYFSQRRSI